MFDVGDLPVLTFGNYVLKTGVIKRHLKLYYVFFTFLRFFSKSKNMTFTFFELLHTFSRTLSTTDTQQPSQRSMDAIADRSPRRSRRVIADKSTTRQTPPTCRRPKRFVGLVWSGRVRVVEFRNYTTSSKVWPGRLYRLTANTTDFHHHHHFICPIIQQYAHLHEYGLEEQDSKVR